MKQLLVSLLSLCLVGSALAHPPTGAKKGPSKATPILKQALEDASGRFVGLANFIAYAQTPALLDSLVNSLGVAALVTLIVVMLNFLICAVSDNMFDILVYDWYWWFVVGAGCSLARSAVAGAVAEAPRKA